MAQHINTKNLIVELDALSSFTNILFDYIFEYNQNTLMMAIISNCRILLKVF